MNVLAALCSRRAEWLTYAFEMHSNVMEKVMAARVGRRAKIFATFDFPVHKTMSVQRTSRKNKNHLQHWDNSTNI